MAKYLLAYHGGGMPESPEEQQRVMAAWGQWYQNLGAAVVADPGNPVGQTRTISSNRSISNGGGANPISGYTIIQADSFDKAVDLAKGCPILDGNGSIEVCETFDAM